MTSRDNIRALRVLLVITAILVWLSVLSSIAHAQGSAAKSEPWKGPFQYGFVTDSARAEMSAEWDDTHAYQVERAYCIEAEDVKIDTLPGALSVYWTVHHVHKPDSVTLALPNAIGFTCSEKAIGSIHVHTPTTCTEKPAPLGFHTYSCVLGGPEAYWCDVDEQDRRYATRSKEDISGVQCSRDAFIFYWPGKRG